MQAVLCHILLSIHQGRFSSIEVHTRILEHIKKLKLLNEETYQFQTSSFSSFNLGLVMIKAFFGVYDQVIRTQACSATSWIIDILQVASKNMIVSKERIT